MEYKSIWKSFEEEPVEGRYILIRSSLSGKGFVGTSCKRLNCSLPKGYEFGIKENYIVTLDGKYAKEWCYYYDFCKNANIIIDDCRLERTSSNSCLEKSILEETCDALINRRIHGMFK